MKITKGEWICSKYPGGDWGVYSTDGDGRDIALVRGKANNKESEANAKVIAAAPNLFYACARLVSILDSEGEAFYNKYIAEFNEGIDALKKATE